MRTRVLLISLILILPISGGCTKRPLLTDDALSYDYFEKHLSAEMTYPEIVTNFGEPDADIGSGIHIYVYELADSTELWIGYTDRILYARHLDGNHQLLQTLSELRNIQNK